jgi:SsrA-binding protein
MADIANNKKARHDYIISEKYEAGIELKGTEVKSIRAGKVNIRDTFGMVDNGQLMLYGCDIQAWETAGTWFQHGVRRPRRLLMHKKEILKIDQQLSQKGFTLVCLRLYWKGRRVKAELGLAKGKAHADQRQSLKERVENLEAKREVARFNQKFGV